MKRFMLGFAVASMTFSGMAVAEEFPPRFAAETSVYELAFADKEAGAEKTEGKTKTVTAGDLKLTIPETWKQPPTTSSMRLAQFEVPAAAGDSEDGEIVIFNFGAAGGGGVDANVKRWVGQFQEEGRKQKIL